MAPPKGKTTGAAAAATTTTTTTTSPSPSPITIQQIFANLTSKTCQKAVESLETFLSTKPTVTSRSPKDEKAKYVTFYNALLDLVTQNNEITKRPTTTTIEEERTILRTLLESNYRILSVISKWDLTGVLPVRSPEFRRWHHFIRINMQRQDYELALKCSQKLSEMMKSQEEYLADSSTPGELSDFYKLQFLTHLDRATCAFYLTLAKKTVENWRLHLKNAEISLQNAHSSSTPLSSIEGRYQEVYAFLNNAAAYITTAASRKEDVTEKQKANAMGLKLRGEGLEFISAFFNKLPSISSSSSSSSTTAIAFAFSENFILKAHKAGLAFEKAVPQVKATLDAFYNGELGKKLELALQYRKKGSFSPSYVALKQHHASCVSQKAEEILDSVSKYLTGFTSDEARAHLSSVYLQHALLIYSEPRLGPERKEKAVLLLKVALGALRSSLKTLKIEDAAGGTITTHPPTYVLLTQVLNRIDSLRVLVSTTLLPQQQPTQQRNLTSSLLFSPEGAKVIQQLLDEGCSLVFEKGMSWDKKQPDTKLHHFLLPSTQFVRVACLLTNATLALEQEFTQGGTYGRKEDVDDEDEEEEEEEEVDGEEWIRKAKKIAEELGEVPKVAQRCYRLGEMAYDRKAHSLAERLFSLSVSWLEPSFPLNSSSRKESKTPQQKTTTIMTPCVVDPQLHQRFLMLCACRFECQDYLGAMKAAGRAVLYQPEVFAHFTSPIKLPSGSLLLLSSSASPVIKAIEYFVSTKLRALKALRAMATTLTEDESKIRGTTLQDEVFGSLDLTCLTLDILELELGLYQSLLGDGAIQMMLLDQLLAMCDRGLAESDSEEEEERVILVDKVELAIRKSRYLTEKAVILRIEGGKEGLVEALKLAKGAVFLLQRPPTTRTLEKRKKKTTTTRKSKGKSKAKKTRKREEEEEEEEEDDKEDEGEGCDLGGQISSHPLLADSLATAHCWEGIIRRDVGESPDGFLSFKSAIITWNAVLTPAPSSSANEEREALLRRFKNPNSTYRCLRVMADLLSLLSRKLKLWTLRIMTQLNERVRIPGLPFSGMERDEEGEASGEYEEAKPQGKITTKGNDLDKRQAKEVEEVVTDSVFAYCECFRLYSDIGFLGKGNGVAESYLEKANQLMGKYEHLVVPASGSPSSSFTSPSLSRLNWNMMKAIYLSEVRMFEESQRLLEETIQSLGQYIESSPEGVLLTRKSKRAEILQATCKSTLASTLLKQGSSPALILNETTKCYDYLKRRQNLLISSKAALSSGPLGGVGVERARGNTKGDHLSFSDPTQWRITESLLDSVETLGKVYELTGSSESAKKYYRCGKTLSGEMHATRSDLSFSLRLAEFECTRHKWTKCEAHLEEAKRLLGELPRDTEEVETLEVKLAMIQGDYLYNQGNYEQALEEYKQATSVLVRIADISYLRKIERIPDLSVEQMYNAPKMMTEIPKKITARSKGRSKATTTTVRSSTLNDEVPLDSLLGQIKVRQASTLLMQLQQMGNTKGGSSLEEVKRLLKEALKNHPCTELDKSVILCNLGAAYLSRTPIHPLWWSTSSFPSSLSKVSSSSLDGFEKGMRYLFEAYSLCAGATARPDLMRRIAQELSLRAEDPSTAAYRLQASFGITMNNRRRTILGLKQSQLEQGVAPKCITTNLVPLSSSSSSSTSTRAKKGTTRTTTKSKLELLLDDSSSSSFSSSSSVYLGSGEEKEDIQKRIEAFSKALHKTPLLPSLSSMTLDTEVVKMVKSMPREWTVCSLGIETTTFSHSERYLLVTRLTKEFEPVVIRLPLFSEETEDAYQGILSELKEIMKENKDSLFSDNPDMRDPVKWNQKRIDLDLRVKDLVLRLEHRWLGCWKGVLLGSPVEAEIESALEMEAISLSTLIQQQNTSRQSANCSLTLRELIKCCLSSFDQLQPSQVKECLSFLLRQSGGSATVTAAVSSVLMEAFRKSNECLKSKEKAPQIQRNPTVLILDRELNGLPWECTPILQGVPVTRMPSLSFLLAAVSAKQVDAILRRGVDTRKTFYLIDPHESLEKTKVLLQPYFKQHQWNGVTKPKRDQALVRNALEQHELFIYCGHNGGEQFLQRGEIRDLNRCAVALLFGCSSGRLKGSGEYEPEGNVLNYLLAGCPAVVANLWDVTDKDLDLFSKELMDSWIDGRSTISPSPSSFDKTSLPSCVAMARKKCKWPFIVGAAPVCYGVPVINRSGAAVLSPPAEPKKVVKRKK